MVEVFGAFADEIANNTSLEGNNVGPFKNAQW